MEKCVTCVYWGLSIDCEPCKSCIYEENKPFYAPNKMVELITMLKHELNKLK